MNRYALLPLAIISLAPACGQQKRPAPAAVKQAPVQSRSAAASGAPKGVEVSLEAVLDKACQGGDPRSCFVLGRKLLTGRGVKKDETRGRGYLEQACVAGHEQSCAELGRPVHYQSVVQGGVPSRLRLKSFQAVSIGSFLGPDGQRLRAALSKPVEQGCDCLVSYSKDLDFLGEDELLLAGIVLDHRVSAEQEALDKVTIEQKKELSSLIPSSEGGKETGGAAAALPEKCKGSAVTAKLWLIISGKSKEPASVLVHGRGGKGLCTKSVDEAIADLAKNIASLLSNQSSRRVTLYKDPNIPALEQGNEHARSGAWETAYSHYGAAMKQADAGELPGATRGHIRYLQGLALAQLHRYEESLAALKEARKINPDNRYLIELERVISVGTEAWSAPPPVERKAKGKRKRRRLYWQPRIKRKVVWE